MSLRDSKPCCTMVRADGQDAKALAELHAKAFVRAWDESAFAQLLGEAPVLGIKAIGQSGDAMAGFVLARAIGDEAEILTLAVDPDQRGSGIGTQLCQALIESLKGPIAVKLFLEVAEDNDAALGLYRKLGFRAVGRRQGYYKGLQGEKPKDCINLRLVLQDG